MNTAAFSVCFSFAYVYLIGVFALPRGMGATVVSVVLMCFLLREINTRGIELPRFSRILLGLSVLIALSFCFVTNELVILLAALCQILTLSWLLASLAMGEAVGETPRELLAAFWMMLDASSRRIDSYDPAIERVSRLEPAFFHGLVLSVLPIIFFNILFCAVNPSYQEFITSTLSFLFRIELWKPIVVAILQSLFLNHLLQIRFEKSELHEFTPRREAAYVLLPCLLVFALFSCFQGSELLAMEGELSFKDRSLYVQSGFWELLVVAGMGYALWAMCKIAGCDLSPRVKLRSLLACFAAELLLIGIFSLHKIGTLQWVFGLKDSRLLATMVVCSVVSVFVLCLLHLGSQLSFRWIARVPLLLMFSTTTAAAYGNLDLFVTTVHPIRYQVDRRFHKDYAYLLTNSYDNYSEWGELMLELLERGEIETPANYYWGNYKPLCESHEISTIASYRERIKDRSSYGSYKSSYAEPKTLVNYLKAHHQYLLDKYKDKRPGLKQAMRANYREKEALRWLQANQTLIGDFYQLVETHCGN